MKRKIQHWTAALLFAASLGGATLAVATPQTTLAACNDRLLTFPAWFRGLTDGDCNIMSPTQAGGLQKFIWTIALNVVEILLQAVGYISVVFIIYGGFKYMISGDSPDGMKKAKDTVLNALIGLVIAVLAVGIVNLIAGAVK